MQKRMEAGQGAVSGFIRKASLVIYVLDDFNGRPLKPNQVHIRIEGEKSPVGKDDGYFVFMNLLNKAYIVSLEGYGFHRQEIAVDLTGSSVICPVITVRLTPNQCYPLPRAAACVEGYADPLSIIRIGIKRPGKSYKLLYDYPGERIMRIYSPDSRELDGRMFMIQETELLSIEYTVDREERIYQLKAPLASGCKKAGTGMIPVMETIADENGYYFTAVKGISAQDTGCTADIYRDAGSGESVVLIPGKTVTVNRRKEVR